MEAEGWTSLDFRSARVHARLSQAKVAASLQVSQSTLSRFESGKDGALKPEQKLALITLILAQQKKEG